MDAVYGSANSGVEQPACQHRLHVTATVDDQMHKDLFPCYAIDQAIRFEEYLAIFLDAESKQFLGMAASFGKMRQPIHGFHQTVKQVIGL